MISDVSDRDFDRVVGHSQVPVLVEFWKPGCGGCRALTRQLERLVGEVSGSLLVLKMNVEENFQIPSELEINFLARTGAVPGRTVRALHRRSRHERGNSQTT